MRFILSSWSCFRVIAVLFTLSVVIHLGYGGSFVSLCSYLFLFYFIYFFTCIINFWGFCLS